MSRKRNEAFTQLIVGVFMIAVIALLGYFTIVVSGVDIFSGRAQVKLAVSFAHVGGLKDHDNVMFRGTKVGTVDHVVVTPTNLLVIANVDENVVLRKGCRATVCNVSMLGGNYLQLEEGEGEPIDLSTAVLSGESPTDWMRDVSRIAKTMNELVNRREVSEIVSNVSAITARSRQIVDRVDEVMERVQNGNGLVGRVLSDDDSLYSNIENTVSNVNDVVSRVNRGESLVGRLLAKDDQLIENLESAVSNVNVVVSRVSRGEGFVGRMLSTDDEFFTEVRASVTAFRKACESFDFGDAKGDFKSLAANGNRLIENLNAVAEKLRKGEGTLGRLANDQGMYNEVEGLIKDCRQIIDNYRDTTPISTFSSILSGAL